MDEIENDATTSEPQKVYTGTVIFFGTSKKDGVPSTKSYGFIEWWDEGVQQRDMFAHFSDILGTEGEYRTLKKGQNVSFKIGKNNYGEPKAIDIVKLPPIL